MEVPSGSAVVEDSETQEHFGETVLALTFSMYVVVDPVTIVERISALSTVIDVSDGSPHAFTTQPALS